MSRMGRLFFSRQREIERDWQADFAYAEYKRDSTTDILSD